jgi:uncharacterized spore protein YtfJ
MAKKSRVAGVRELLERFGGARLCYGEPVRVGERAVVPVAKVRVAGGWGYGSGEDGDGDGGGGGGWLEAQPIGYLDCGPDGTRFEAIPDPERHAQRLRAGAAAVATVLTAAGVARRMLRR